MRDVISEHCTNVT